MNSIKIKGIVCSKNGLALNNLTFAIIDRSIDPYGTPHFTNSKFAFFFVIYLRALLFVI